MQILRRFALLGVMIGLCLPSFAQVIKQDTLLDQPSTAAAGTTFQSTLDNLFSTYAPKSPTSASLSRYGEYPVSLYTGLPTIEIPIFDFKVGTLTVPIKLSYHAAGHKINDLASWVGLGWSLQTGGMITRTVAGRPDEQANGVLSQTITNPNTRYDDNCKNESSVLFMKERADNIIDTQRDMFAYQTPSGRNTFILTPGSTGYVALTPEPITIATSSGLSSLTLTDPSGTRFNFADQEVTSASGNTPYGYSNFTSSWYLTDITSLNSSERAIYSYTVLTGLPTAPEPVDIQIVNTNLSADGPSGVSTGDQGVSSSDASVVVAPQFPREIQFPGGKISFVLESRAGGGVNLNYIDIFSYDVTSTQYVLLKRIDLEYTTSNRVEGDNTVGSETFLSKVRLFEGNQETEVGAYTFTYNPLALPAAGGKRKDYWGYYNGATSNSNLIPTQTITYEPNGSAPGSISLVVGGANREPDEAYMQAWMLQRIQYPTGGFTEFTFETNRYAENGLSAIRAGGLRIKQIRNYTSATELASTKTYTYGPGESGDGTKRVQIDFKPFSVQNFNSYNQATATSNISYSSRIYSSAPSYPLSPAEGSPVTYSVVTERTVDGAGVSQGKTVYQYRDAAIDSYNHLGAGKGYLNSQSWNRGQLLNQTVTDATGQLRSKTENTYSTLVSGNTSDLVAVIVYRYLKQVAGIDRSGNCSPVDDGFVYLYYSFSFGSVKLVRSDEYTYADDNSGRYTKKTTETDYDPIFYLPKETRLKAEGGIVLGTQYVYPQHFNPISTTTTVSSPELQGIRALQQRNAYLPVETVNYRKESASAKVDYKTGQLTSYTAVTLNGRPTALPYQTYLMESDNNTFSPAILYKSSAKRYNSANNTSSFLLDSSYVLRLTMNGYDANGNLKGYTVTRGSSTTFGYSSYTPSGGVLFSTVIQQTLNAGQPNALTTSYAYTRPLLGPASTTDPKGVTTSYVYDGFGRLSAVKDKDNYVIKQYTYHYATAP